MFKKFRAMNATYDDEGNKYRFISYSTPIFIFNKKTKTLTLNYSEYSITTKRQVSTALRELLGNQNSLIYYSFRKNIKNNQLINGIRVLRRDRYNLYKLF